MYAWLFRHLPGPRWVRILLAVLLLAGRIEWAMYVGFGAFTGIYSRYEPTRARFRRQLLAGTMLTLCVTLGAGLAQIGPLLPEALASWIVIVVAALVAGGIGLASGLPFPYWAQVAAVAPLASPGHGARIEKGVHRLVGTVLGVVVTAFLLSFPVEPWQLVVWAVLLQFLAEMFILRNYSIALLFITPLALLMVQLGHPQPAGPMLQARVLETAIGVVVGLALVLGRYARERRSALAD